EQTADREHDRDHDQIEDGDALVVDREQPRADAELGVQVVVLRERWSRAFGQRLRSLHGFIPWAAAAVAGGRPSFAPSGRLYASSCSSCSSLSCPWNVGICGA